LRSKTPRFEDALPELVRKLLETGTNLCIIKLVFGFSKPESALLTCITFSESFSAIFGKALMPENYGYYSLKELFAESSLPIVVDVGNTIAIDFPKFQSWAHKHMSSGTNADFSKLAADFLDDAVAPCELYELDKLERRKDWITPSTLKFEEVCWKPVNISAFICPRVFWVVREENLAYRR